MIILKSKSQVANFLKRNQSTDYNHTIYDMGSAFVSYKETRIENNKVVEEKGESNWWDSYETYFSILAIIKIKKK